MLAIYYMYMYLCMNTSSTLTFDSSSDANWEEFAMEMREKNVMVTPIILLHLVNYKHALHVHYNSSHQYGVAYK